MTYRRVDAAWQAHVDYHHVGCNHHMCIDQQTRIINVCNFSEFSSTTNITAIVNLKNKLAEIN